MSKQWGAAVIINRDLLASIAKLIQGFSQGKPESITGFLAST
jgi:hypothetical protein